MANGGNGTMMGFIKKILNIFKSNTATKHTISQAEFDAIKSEFVKVRSRFSANGITPVEEKQISMQLQTIAEQLPAVQRVLDFISLLVDALEMENLETERKEIAEKWIALTGFLKRSELPELIKDFNDTHFMMLFSLDSAKGTGFETRRHYLALEIADRLGGIEFVKALDSELTNNSYLQSRKLL